MDNRVGVTAELARSSWESDGWPIICYVIGYFIAVVLGHILVWPTVKTMWEAYPNGKPNKKNFKLSGVLGCVERTLYVACLSSGHAGFIAVWLGLKLMGKWRFAGEKNNVSTSGSGTVNLNLLLVGSALSLAYGALGAYSIRWLLMEEYIFLAVATLALVAGTLRLLVYFRFIVKPDPNRAKNGSQE